MLLDNWLAQRAQTCPDRLAVCGDGIELTYLELEREATSAARRLAAKGVRRDAVVALELSPGRRVHRAAARPDEARRRRLPAQHATDRAGARRRARARPAGAGPLRVRRRGAHRGRPAAARRARPRGAALPDPDQRHLGAPAADRPHLRQLPVERRRLRVQPRGRAHRSLALLRAAQPRGRDVDRPALGDLRNRDRHPRRVRRRCGRRVARGGRSDGGVARRDPAGATARGRSRSPAAARRAGRRRAGPRRRPAGGDRARRHRGPDLRLDRDRLRR